MSDFQNGGDDLEQILENEKRNLVVDDSIKNDVHLTSSEINLLANEVTNSKEFLVIAEEINISDLEDVRRDTDEVEPLTTVKTPRMFLLK
jgi:predicted metal-dependent hydrolase